MATNITFGLKLYKFANYYDRKLEYYAEVADYNSNGTLLLDYKGYNFKFNDGVNTSIILNQEIEADYLITYDLTKPSIVTSRWYILERHLIRGGQSEYMLKRDILADNYYSVIQAPSMIRKAMLSEDDSFILNNEGQAFNQVKKKETLLKDLTECPWIIGYIPRDSKIENEITFKTLIADYKTPFNYASWNNFAYHDYIKDIGSKSYKLNNYNNIVQVAFNISGIVGSTIMLPYDVNKKQITEAISVPSGFVKRYYSQNGFYCFYYAKSGITSNLVTFSDSTRLFERIFNQLRSIDIASDYLNALNINSDDNLKKYDNQIFKVNNINYDISYLTNENVIENTSPKESDSIVTKLNTALNKLTENGRTGSFDVNCYKLNAETQSINLVAATKLATYSITLPSPELRQHITNSGYDIFALPFSDLLSMEDVSSQVSIKSNKDVNLGIANAIMTALSGSTVDLQILPYCPFLDAYNEQYKYLDISLLNYTAIKNNNSNVGFVFWLNNDSFSFYIDEVTSKEGTSRKVINECYMWRLCAPNYSSQFEFNIAKNNGVVYSYNVDVTLRPYAPYVHVNPLFTGDLYGSDFNDKRGLILSGDYSLPLVSNAWAQYTLNNKNYLNSFNREIDSLELQNKWNFANSISSAISSTISGTIGASLLGGGAIGRSVAAGALAVGGLADIVGGQMLRNDNIDKIKTLFNYNLQNIQAMPSTINKGSILDFNNKFFPIIEEYSATQEEINSFINKIKWDGMTVNRIGTIQEFMNYTINENLKLDNLRYFEAIPLRLGDNKSMDYHMANEIYSEMEKGFYIKEG